MSEYINGYSNPIIRIFSNGTYIEDIELNLCDETGLIERIEPVGSIIHNCLNGTVRTRHKGLRQSFTLNYSYSNKDNSLKIQRLINYIINNYNIQIVPRSDVPSRRIDVICVNPSTDLGIMKGGSNSIGNKNITLQFQSKNMLLSLNWVNPDDIGTLIEDFIII